MLTKLKDLIDKDLTTYEIAEVLGKSRQTIMSWLKKYQLKTKFKRGQTKNTYKHFGNTNLRKSCFEIKRPLRHRRLLLEFPERNKCEICQGNKNMEIHHKDKNRLNNHKDNIMVVCHKCHQTKLHNCSSHLPKDGGWSKRRGD